MSQVLVTFVLSALICQGNTGSTDGITTPLPSSTSSPPIWRPWESPPPVLNDAVMDEHEVLPNRRNPQEDSLPYTKSFDSETFKVPTTSKKKDKRKEGKDGILKKRNENY